MTGGTNALPNFGLIEFSDPDGTGPGACLGGHSLDVLDDMSPETLRQLAADAIAAAEWLEANR